MATPVSLDEFTAALNEIKATREEYGSPLFRYVDGFDDITGMDGFGASFAWLYETTNYIYLVYQARCDDKRRDSKVKWRNIALAKDGVIDQQKYEVFALAACRAFTGVVNGLVPSINDKGTAEYSSTPHVWYKDVKQGVEHKAYEYDMNSAYGYAMRVAPLPDTRRPLGKGILEKGQIGFNPGMSDVVTTSVGDVCKYRFPLLSDEDRAPMTKWVDRWYNIKRTTKDPIEKAKAKAFIVIPVGNFQNHNWFMRTAIVEYCNNIMESLEEKYPSIIKSNTDAVISTKRIPELEANIGDGLGQWKLEKTGYLLYIGNNEQWFDENHNTIDIKVRGVRKSKIPEDFNILTNRVYVESNKYTLQFEMGNLQEPYIAEDKSYVC